MKKKKKIVYRDELNDDFANTNIHAEKIGDSYRYISKNPLWILGEYFLYYIICPPILYFWSKFRCGLRIEGKEKLKKIKGGYFLFCNHTQMVLDAFHPVLLSLPKRTYIITGPEAVSVKGIRKLVKMLGSIPVASTVKGLRNMDAAVRQRVESGKVITIYPEAHIWPYYTKVRPFMAGSFRFAVKSQKPCFSATTTYRERKILFYKCKRPGITIYLDGPFYPDAALSQKKAEQQLRDKVYFSMIKNSNQYVQKEYIEYVKDESNDYVVNDA